MSTIEKEVSAALADYTQRLPLHELRELCNAAEEWYDRANSRMKEFARRNGYLADGEAYRQLAAEARACLPELNHNPKSPWRASLLKLNGFGTAMYRLDQKLRQMAVLVAELAACGMAEQYVTGVVTYALRDGRAAAKAA